MPLITATIAVDGITAVSTTRTTFESVTDVLMAPFGFTAPATDYVQKKQAAYSAVAYGATGFLVGEALGNKRGRMNKQSWLPLFRGQ